MVGCGAVDLHRASKSGSSAVHRLILAGIVSALGSGWVRRVAQWRIRLECFLICAFGAARDANVKKRHEGEGPARHSQINTPTGLRREYIALADSH